MHSRTNHLIAMVKEGASLADAGRVYGITRERVRQILKDAGISGEELPARAEMPRRRHSARSRQLAPVIEAMWREGMLYHEIAEVLGISCEAVHRVIYERVPSHELRPLATARRGDRLAADERLLDGLRKAADVLAAVPGINPADRRRAQAVIAGWLEGRGEAAEVADASSPSERLSAADLRHELDRFKADLRTGGLRESTIHAYLLGSSLFVRWLAGDYVPGSGRNERPSAPNAVRPLSPSGDVEDG